MAVCRQQDWIQYALLDLFTKMIMKESETTSHDERDPVAYKHNELKRLCTSLLGKLPIIMARLI